MAIGNPHCVGRAIRICRAAAGIKKKELARRAELSESMLSLVERGKRTLSVDALCAISRALEIPLDTLLMFTSTSEELDELPPAAYTAALTWLQRAGR